MNYHKIYIILHNSVLRLGSHKLDFSNLFIDVNLNEMQQLLKLFKRLRRYVLTKYKLLSNKTIQTGLLKCNTKKKCIC